MSYFVKGGMGVIDLHPVLDMLADAAADEKIKEDFLQMTKACGALAQAAPPLSPAAMSVKIAHSTFSNGADEAFVIGRYEATFRAVLARAKQLNFNQMEWVTVEEWATFIREVLPLCAGLEGLLLSINPNLEVDIVELVATLPPTLKKLYLMNTGCFGDATKADWSRVPELKVVMLKGTKVEGTAGEIKAAGCKGFIGI